MFSPKHCRLWPRGEYHTIHLALNLGIIWCGWKNKVILIKALSKAILPGFLAFCCTDKHVSTWIKLRYSEGCKPHDRTVLLYHCTWNYLLHMMPRLQCMCHYDSAFTGTVQLGLKLILRLLLSLSRFPKLLWMTSSVQSAQHLVTCRNGNRIWVKSNGTITLSQLFTTRDCFFFLAAAATRSYVPHSYCNVKTMMFLFHGTDSSHKVRSRSFLYHKLVWHIPWYLSQALQTSKDACAYLFSTVFYSSCPAVSCMPAPLRKSHFYWLLFQASFNMIHIHL